MSAPMPPACTCKRGQPDPACPGNTPLYRTILDNARDANRMQLRAAVMELLAAHQPAPRQARRVDWLDCPDHNPADHPEVLRAAFDTTVCDNCPTCEVTFHDVCSARDCMSCEGWPCTTVRTIARWCE